jgi:hypothetical protein
MVKYFCDFNFTKNFYISKEPKKIQSEFINLTNFTLFELIDEVKKVNMPIGHSQDIRTRDVSNIDTAVDAASFLVSIIIQTYLDKNKQQKLESPPSVHIVINNQLCNNHIITNNNNDTSKLGFYCIAYNIVKVIYEACGNI